ncbi:hypothetical protein BDV96DRAFT_681872 [Lophiotrema nucula]|uniref:Uncharacterized protein n=1 Tax=Lophiotrema nucula TaxID=690887 RepID=A0A6A5ZQ39_9PLEO|nr:hypothetical protein BDV96DRAFT_681872 [Lophiotrema nucula]
MEVALRGGGSHESNVSSSVSNLIHAFTNGLDIFKRFRERRRKRKSKHHKTKEDPTSGAELQLSNSLRRGPADIQSNYEKHLSKAGDRFAKGDAIAHASLAETLLKLNTGLIGIIHAFLNQDSKDRHLNLDYNSLTSLSDASRAEAVHSLDQLYQRLSKSNLQLYRVGACPRCNSMKHHNCSGGAIDAPRKSSQPEKRRRNASRSRSSSGPTVARVPVKSTSQTHLVVVRPKTTRKGSSSSASTTKTQSTATSSPYASPLGSPLPQYSPTDPYPPKQQTQGEGGRKRAGSFDGPRPTTWPNPLPPNMQNYTFGVTMPAPIPPPKIPLTQRSPPPREKNTPSPSVSPARRRIDKVTPSTYTFASDSTKLGEIPQNKWTSPWNYAEAERMNAKALANGYPQFQTVGEKPKKKGLFGFLRRGTAEN